MRSLPETSALLPTEMNVDRPINAIASGTETSDAHYSSVESSIASLTGQRDELEAQMRTALTNAAFGGSTASEQQLKDMIARGGHLLDQASTLAANS